MEQYISFPDDTVLDVVAPPEGFLKDWTGVTVPRNAQSAFTHVPTKEKPVEKAVPTEVVLEEAAPIGGPLEEPTTPQVLCEEWTKVEASPNQFPG